MRFSGRRPTNESIYLQRLRRSYRLIRTPGGKSMPCDATPRYYIEKPRSGSKKIVTPNGEVISCEYTEDPHKATGTGFAPHWGSCRAAGAFRK